MTELRFHSDTKHRKGFFTGVSFSHPAKMIFPLQLWLYENYTKPGDVVLDPMAGSGTALVGCSMGRHVICVELEQKFIELIKGNWEKIQQRGPMLGCEMGTATILQGDARNLESLLESTCQIRDVFTQQVIQNTTHGQNEPASSLGKVSSIITSPPYADMAHKTLNNPEDRRDKDPTLCHEYSDNPTNIGNLPYGEIDAVITSPPFGGSEQMYDTDWIKKHHWRLHRPDSPSHENNPSNIGSLPYGSVEQVDAVITSPPYADINQSPRDNPDPTADKRKRGNIGKQYSDAKDNIGNLKAASYLDAMYQVYQQCFKVLRDGGLMILVVKNFIRDKKEIRLDLDTRLLAERAGFDFVEEHHRVLTSQSFWRTIYYQKFPDVPRIDREYVLVFKRSI